MSDRRLEAARGQPRAYFLLLCALLMIGALWRWLGLAWIHPDGEPPPGRYLAHLQSTGNLEGAADIYLQLRADGTAELTDPNGNDGEFRQATGSWSRDGKDLRLALKDAVFHNTPTRDEDVLFWEGVHLFKISRNALTSLGTEGSAGQVEPYRRVLHGFNDEFTLVYDRTSD